MEVWIFEDYGTSEKKAFGTKERALAFIQKRAMESFEVGLTESNYRYRRAETTEKLLEMIREDYEYYMGVVRDADEGKTYFEEFGYLDRLDVE